MKYTIIICLGIIFSICLPIVIYKIIAHYTTDRIYDHLYVERIRGKIEYETPRILLSINTGENYVELTGAIKEQVFRHLYPTMDVDGLEAIMNKYKLAINTSQGNVSAIVWTAGPDGKYDTEDDVYSKNYSSALERCTILKNVPIESLMHR